MRSLRKYCQGTSRAGSCRGAGRGGWRPQARLIRQLSTLSALRALAHISMEKGNKDNEKIENEINCSLGLLNVNCIWIAWHPSLLTYFLDKRNGIDVICLAYQPNGKLEKMQISGRNFRWIGIRQRRDSRCLWRGMHYAEESQEWSSLSSSLVTDVLTIFTLLGLNVKTCWQNLLMTLCYGTWLI